MKNYRITVNGNTYDVQVEEINGAAPAAPIAAAPVAAAPTQAPVAAAPVAAPAAAPATSGGEPVKSPMPGNILDIKVKAGDKVGENQVVLVLEAMKMENEIVTPIAGTVASVNVSVGQAVNSGDVLITVAK